MKSCLAGANPEYRSVSALLSRVAMSFWLPYAFNIGTRPPPFPSSPWPLRCLLPRCALISVIGLSPDLTEPIDVYTDWIDECEAVNAVEGVAEERKNDEEFIDEREIAEG